MRSFSILLLATLGWIAQAQTPAEGLLTRIRAEERAVPVMNQALTGTWLLELRGPGLRPARPNLVTFHEGGTVVAASSTGTESAHHGVWIRAGNRKFSQTMYLFGYNEQNALATITKVRIAAQLSEDALTMRGTAEIVIIDPQGGVIATIPGVEYSGVRLAVEKPADADAFLRED